MYINEVTTVDERILGNTKCTGSGKIRSRFRIKEKDIQGGKD